MNLLDAIEKRKSIREFDDKPTQEETDLIVEMAYKIPSAGGLYPLNLKVVGNDFIIYAEFQKTMAKYGTRGIQYVFMEAGHMAQNILLVATSLGLSSYPIGAFNEGYNEKEIPIYIIKIGRKQ